MQNMDRTRIIFVVIIGVALLIICGAAAFSLLSGALGSGDEPTPIAVNTTAPGEPTATRVIGESPEPVWGPNYDPADGVPAYVCGADAFGSYFTLQQMQMSGKDIEHGFHLGIVPFSLDDDPAYDVSEEQRTALLETGQWNCLLTTLDSVALKSPGIITAIVDESAGADQLWGRDIETINELQGQRIAFSRGSVGEYFAYYALSIAQLSPRSDVTLVPQDSVAGAIEEIRVAEGDVLSPSSNLLANVGQHHLTLDKAEAPTVDRHNRAVPAQVLAASTGFGVAYGHLSPVAGDEMSVFSQVRQTGAVGSQEVLAVERNEGQG